MYGHQWYRRPDEGQELSPMANASCRYNTDGPQVPGYELRAQERSRKDVNSEGLLLCGGAMSLIILGYVRDHYDKRDSPCASLAHVRATSH
eukprot:766177-Hanusia_phi.AAC.6